MNTETIRLEPSRFSGIHYESSPKSADAPIRSAMLSPYDTPEAVIITEDDHQYRLKIRYMFEPTTDMLLEPVADSGCVLSVDPVSGRINSLTVDKTTDDGQRLVEILRALAKKMDVPAASFKNGGPGRAVQFRRAVLPIVLEEAASSLGNRHTGGRF